MLYCGTCRAYSKLRSRSSTPKNELRGKQPLMIFHYMVITLSSKQQGVSSSDRWLSIWLTVACDSLLLFLKRLIIHEYISIYMNARLGTVNGGTGFVGVGGEFGELD